MSGNSGRGAFSTDLPELPERQRLLDDAAQGVGRTRRQPEAQPTGLEPDETNGDTLGPAEQPT